MVTIVNEIIAKLKEITEINHVQIWNSQFDYLDEDSKYAFAFPCAFTEFTFPEGFQQLGSQYQGQDIEIKIHLGNDFYNGSQYDDNFNIFTLRDLVVKKLSGFKPSEGGNLIKIGEEQDYNHSNVYHYTLTFKAHYIDQTAVKTQIYTVPPTNWNKQ